MTTSKTDPEASRRRISRRRQEAKIGLNQWPALEWSTQPERRHRLAVMLLSGLRSRAPWVLDELAGLLESSDRETDLWRWAIRHGLAQREPDPVAGVWVVETAAATLELWEIDSESLRVRDVRLRLPWVTVMRPGGLGQSGVPEYEPTIESRARAKARLLDRPTSYFDDREKTRKAEGFRQFRDPNAGERSAATIRRLIEFQVLRRSCLEIARDELEHETGSPWDSKSLRERRQPILDRIRTERSRGASADRLARLERQSDPEGSRLSSLVRSIDLGVRAAADLLDLPVRRGQRGRPARRKR